MRFGAVPFFPARPYSPSPKGVAADRPVRVGGSDVGSHVAIPFARGYSITRPQRERGWAPVATCNTRHPLLTRAENWSIFCSVSESRPIPKGTFRSKRELQCKPLSVAL